MSFLSETYMAAFNRREFQSDPDEVTHVRHGRTLANNMARGNHQSQIEYDRMGWTQSTHRAMEIDSTGYNYSSLFRDLPNRGKVVRVREVTNNNTRPNSHARYADLPNKVVPWHQMGMTSEHRSLPIPPQHPIMQGMIGHHMSAFPPQWQIQANDSSGMSGQDGMDSTISNSSSATSSLVLQGMAGYDVWSMLPSHMREISLSCTTKPFNCQDPEDMNWPHPENESDFGHSFTGPDYLNLGRAPSSIYDPIYQGNTLCADPHLKAYNAQGMNAHGTNNRQHMEQTSSSNGHSPTLLSPEFPVLQGGSDHGQLWNPPSENETWTRGYNMPKY